jgi:hypothetical protein
LKRKKRTEDAKQAEDEEAEQGSAALALKPRSAKVQEAKKHDKHRDHAGEVAIFPAQLFVAFDQLLFGETPKIEAVFLFHAMLRAGTAKLRSDDLLRLFISER